MLNYGTFKMGYIKQNLKCVHVNNYGLNGVKC